MDYYLYDNIIRAAADIRGKREMRGFIAINLEVSFLWTKASARRNIRRLKRIKGWGRNSAKSFWNGLNEEICVSERL